MNITNGYQRIWDLFFCICEVGASLCPIKSFHVGPEPKGLQEPHPGQPASQGVDCSHRAR